VTAKSKSTTDFLITKKDDGSSERTCTQAAKGGCPTGGKW
jgi:hypothetical protein